MFLKFKFLLAFGLVGLLSCSKEDVSKTQNGQTFQYIQVDPSECALTMSYDMVAISYTSAVNPEDQEALSVGERSLALPKWEGCHVEACVMEGGVYMAEIQMFMPAEAPTYPDNILKLPDVPDALKTDRISISDNTVTSYNKAGDVLSVTNRDEADVDFYLNAIEALSSSIEEELPDMDAMNTAMDAFRDAGLDMVAYNSQYEVLTQSSADGGFSKVVFDKTLGGAIVGHANFDAAGNISSKTTYSFSREGNQLRLNRDRFVAYFEAPLSKKKMKMVRNSNYSNFQFTSN